MTSPAPTEIFRTVANQAPRLRVVGEPVPTPRRRSNEVMRPREFLTVQEVDKLIATAKRRGRYGQRDAVAILVRHKRLNLSRLKSYDGGRSLEYLPCLLAVYHIQ